eukprot:TRINITY_DN52935_c1_g1_i1.p1 TRINITY_DN52935_c1_g1~~TRINITY_DN52935_c1_g1_i1.p1  ORF type:complete len:192 (-),score=17.72 TRINITY_DN52935_c1_g1_i1:156-731(-)
MADMTAHAEKLRWTKLGNFRYIISALYSIAKLKRYPYKVTYLTTAADEQCPTSMEDEEKWPKMDEKSTETGELLSGWASYGPPFQWLIALSSWPFVQQRAALRTLQDKFIYTWFATKLSRMEFIRAITTPLPKQHEFSQKIGNHRTGVEKTKAFIVSTTMKNHRVTCDGEFLPNHRELRGMCSDEFATILI